MDEIEMAARLRDAKEEVSQRIQRAGEAQCQGTAKSANAGYYGPTQAVVGAMDSSDSMVRFWLEKKRDQHLIDADSIQALLDMLPAKIPPGAASALQRLLFK